MRNDSFYFFHKPLYDFRRHFILKNYLKTLRINYKDYSKKLCMNHNFCSFCSLLDTCSHHPSNNGTNCVKCLCRVLMIHLENISLHLRRTNFHGNIWILVLFTAILDGKNGGKHMYYLEMSETRFYRDSD